MYPRSVLLLGSNHFGWDGVRSALVALPHFRLIDTDDCAERVRRLATSERPDIIIMPDIMVGLSALPLIRDLRDVCREAAMVVIGGEPDVETLAGLARERIAVSYIRWQDLQMETFVDFLAAVR